MFARYSGGLQPAATPPLGCREADGAAAWIEEHLPEFGRVTGTKFAGGSSWSSAYMYTTDSGRQLFVKTALGRDPEAMFKGEAEGLRAMHGEHSQGRPGEQEKGAGRPRPLTFSLWRC